MPGPHRRRRQDRPEHVLRRPGAATVTGGGSAMSCCSHRVLTDNGAVFTGPTAAAAGSPSRSPCTPAASSSPTPGPTTRRPAARLNASTGPSRTGWPRSPAPTPSSNCRASSTPSAATTTPCGRTAPSTAHRGRGLQRLAQSRGYRIPADRRPLRRQWIEAALDTLKGQPTLEATAAAPWPLASPHDSSPWPPPSDTTGTSEPRSSAP